MKLRLFPRLRAAVLAASVSFTFVTLASGSLGFAQEEQPVEEDAVEVTEEPAEANVLLCEEEAEQLEMALAEQDRIERELAAEEQEEEEIVIPHTQTMFGCDVESPTEYPLTAAENTSDAGVVVQLTERADAFAADAEQMILSGVLTEEEEERELPTMVLSSTSVEYPKASVTGQGAAAVAPRATSVPRLFPAAAAPAPVFFLSGEVSPLAEPEESYASLNQYISRQNDDSVVLNKQSGTFDFGTISKNIRLEGDGVMVLGDVDVDALTTFTGSISGAADWTLSSPAASTYVFQGDVSGWTGKVTTKENNMGASTFRFTNGSAVGTGFSVEFGTVNAELLQSVVSATGSYTQSGAGKLNVAIGAKNSTTTATFTQDVKVNDFKVSSGSSLTLEKGTEVNGLLSVAEGAELTFKSGDLVLNGRADIRGTVKLAAGTNLVVNDEYSIYGSTSSEMKGNVTIGSGAAITVNGFHPESPLLIEGDLTLQNGATFDFSSVQDIVRTVLEGGNYITFAQVKGDLHTKVDTDTQKIISSVILANTGVGGTKLVRAFNMRSGDVTNIVLLVENDTQGYYWHGGTSGVWMNQGGAADWTRTQADSSERLSFTSGHGKGIARSAYFFDPQGANITVKSVNADFSVKHLIIGAGTYTFNPEEGDHSSYITLDVNSQATLTVRSGASAIFNLSVDCHDDSSVLVEKGGFLKISDRYVSSVGLGSAYNGGTMELESFTAMFIRRVTNDGIMNLRDLVDDDGSCYGDAYVGSVINREGAKLYIGKSMVFEAAATDEGDAGLFILNNGTLVFDTDAALGGYETGITNYVEVRGNGLMQTLGNRSILFDERVNINTDAVASRADVTTAYAELNAKQNTFRTHVRVSDKTTIGAGATAEFFDSSSLADAEMMQDAYLVFNNDAEDSAAQYWLNSVSSEAAAAVMTLKNGASVVVEQDMAAPGLAITLEASEALDNSLVVNGNIEAKSLEIRAGASAKILSESGENMLGVLTVQDSYFAAESYTRVGLLSLSGEYGSGINLVRGGFVDEATISGGMLIVDEGSVLTLGHVVQNVSGEFTLEATGASINADYLTLQKTGEGYVEAKTDYRTTNGSGFAYTSEEKVKVVDNASGATLDAAGTIVTHAEASGDLILENDGWAKRNNSEVNWTTYFVREDYMGASADKEVSLTTIQEASKNGGDKVQLQRVTFDKPASVNSRLLVDADTDASLFSVAQNAQGIINIDTWNTVDADSAYTGVTGHLLLEGYGTYHIDSRTNTGTNVSLKDGDWHGNVLVTGRSRLLSLQGLSVGAGEAASYITFRDWTGSLGSVSETTTGQIILDGYTSPNSMTLNHVTGATYTWYNTVSGHGNIVRQDNAKEAFNLRFGGETKNWTGKFVQEQDTVSNLTYTGSGYTVNSGVEVQQGVVKVQYLGKNTTVHSDFNVQEQGKLQLFVGIDNNTTNTTDGAEVVFDGEFNGTESSVLMVYQDSSATFDTNAALEYVWATHGSTVTVKKDRVLTLTSHDKQDGYSAFMTLVNQGTINMQADGGAIQLYGTETPEHDLGHLVLQGTSGTAQIMATPLAQTTITLNDLQGGGQEHILEMGVAMAAYEDVDFRLGGKSHYKGTIRYGVVRESSKDYERGLFSPETGTNLVLTSQDAAASAVLETYFIGEALESMHADVVVEAETAKVQGLTTGANSEGKSMGVRGSSAEKNHTLELIGDGTYAYAGALGENLNVAYTGSGKQTFSGGADNFNGAVRVDNGQDGTQNGMLQLLNATSVKITDLTIGAKDILGVSKNNETDSSSYGEAVVHDRLTSAEAAVANANMKLADSAVVSLGMDGASDNNALSLGGGALTLGHGMSLEGDALAEAKNKAQTAWSATDGGLGSGSFDLNSHAYRVVLFSDVSTLTLDGVTFDHDVLNTDYIFARDYFSNLGDLADYYVITFTQQQGSAGFEVALEVIPEPATSTLSLLALAALCARRRRK